ncbi:uncharacterized protein LAJ45_04711 [Morchella importuna]|uniref:Ceramide glucosyltransferase n=1 Tax=Morchella conica CCBAS932 TaxID=1392247 RepID=A0A3N4KD41_9PEZI|nr:uncharacterized protein LAJ45_04711 [Morchella importuna]KAH8151010.1 hypothetical protein LAJ45_04711 [Morchella importuna]RPB08426.1 hypothetical protein P167DRAFT_539239 [Morchella conica CCBAS932]
MISPRAVIPPVGGRLNDDGVPGTVGELSLAKSTAAWVALVWFIFVWIVGSLGYIQIRRKYRKPHAQRPPLLAKEADALPFVSILRPVKGLDGFLHTCLSSTCLLDYPKSKYELIVCIASPHDPAVPVINEIIETFPDVDIRLIIGEEDVGPNPKIRNMSRGYREAKGDILWILDSNVWVTPGILARSVRMLEGTDRGGKGYKLVHHLPVGIDVTAQADQLASLEAVAIKNSEEHPLLPAQPVAAAVPFWSRIWRTGGGRLEENFLSSSHCKMYVAINTVAVASCVVGKSNLFRRSHLNEATRNPEHPEKEGILAFADHICEDHLLSERLWLTKLEEEKAGTRAWSKHGLGEDLVFQPMGGMRVTDYLARRVRWLRVRKYTLLAAALVEPGTESFLCSLIGAFAVTTLFPECCLSLLGRVIYEPSTWVSFGLFWLASVTAWAAVDYELFMFLHSYRGVEVGKSTPLFVAAGPEAKRGFGPWLAQWVGREACAFGVWMWGMWPGEINWRGSRYRIRWKDLKAEEIGRGSGKRD